MIVGYASQNALLEALVLYTRGEKDGFPIALSPFVRVVVLHRFFLHHPFLVEL